MSQHAAELNTILIADTFGELASNVFSTLCSFGRLSLHTIELHTKLKRGQIKYALALLIQQNAVTWYTSQEEDFAYYEANQTVAYALLSFGKLAKLVEERAGKAAACILDEVHLAGHCNVQDLYSAFLKKYEKGNNASNSHALSANGHLANGTNDHKQSKASPELFIASLKDLIGAQYLVLCHESQYRPLRDNRREAEQVARKQHELYGMLKPSEKVILEQAIESIIEEWKQGSERSRLEIQSRISIGPVSNLNGKRPLAKDEADDKEGRSKRRLTNNGEVHVNGEPNSQVHSRSSSDILRVNYEKLFMLVRNEALVSHAEQAIGDTTAGIYAKVLQMVEHETPGLPPFRSGDQEDEISSTGFLSTHIIFERLKSMGDLADSIAPPNAETNIPAPHSSSRKRQRGTSADGQNPSDIESPEEEVGASRKRRKSGNANGRTSQNQTSEGNEENDSDREEDHVEHHTNGVARRSGDAAHIESLRQHLLLLAGHPTHFLIQNKQTVSTPESWSVSLPDVSAQVRILVLLDIISSRYGAAAFRLTNMLHEKGKLDEKALANQSLLNPKIMRQALTAMHGAGLLELQEVPRDNNRQPAKTIFLWFFDPRRCSLKVLDETYKAMYRIIRRVQVERESYRGVLSKASRSDVVGHEEDLLTKDERVSLETWGKKEAKLFGELGRLDDVVCILKGV